MNNNDLITSDFGGGTVKVTTRTEARKKVLSELGFAILKDYERAYPELSVSEVLSLLAKDHPELWIYDGTKRIIHDRVVTTAFVNDIVDNLITETSAFGDYKYHDSGEDNTAENASDTGLGTPCGEARDTGTQVEGSQTYEYKSVATHTYAGSFTITEHGLFNQSSGGILMDRTVFTGIPVSASDQIEFTFTIQFAAGS